MAGAALVFFAYIGFDALSTAAEETINPQRNVPIGIITSLTLCTIIYIVVSALLTGITSYTTLNVRSPVSNALLNLGHRTAAGIISAGAIAGLTTVMLVMYFGLSRIFLAIAYDGLLPHKFAVINPRTHTPVRIILLSSIFMALVAGLTPIERVAELVNIGTLTAFTFVCAGVIVLRKTHQDMERPFKSPYSPLTPLLGVFFCLYLMINLPIMSWIRFIVWTSIGIVIYISYGFKHSLLGNQENLND
jgi:APA family basic amino acid/polyamine antiporter